MCITMRNWDTKNSLVCRSLDHTFFSHLYTDTPYVHHDIAIAIAQNNQHNQLIVTAATAAAVTAIAAK